jgi:hypothetical protein
MSTFFSVGGICSNLPANTTMMATPISSTSLFPLLAKLSFTSVPLLCYIVLYIISLFLSHFHNLFFYISVTNNHCLSLILVNTLTVPILYNYINKFYFLAYFFSKFSSDFCCYLYFLLCCSTGLANEAIAHRVYSK